MSIKTGDVKTPGGMVRVYGGKHEGVYFSHVELLGHGSPYRVSTCMRTGSGDDAAAALRKIAEECTFIANHIDDIQAQDAYVRAIAADAQEDE
jgi:hypothetical protein